MDSLRAHRIRAGLTQKQLAERLGTDQGAISDYETGRSIPLGPRLQELARELGCSADEIDLSPPDDTTAADESGVSVKGAA